MAEPADASRALENGRFVRNRVAVVERGQKLRVGPRGSLKLSLLGAQANIVKVVLKATR